jgi:hypothetical protein
MLIDSRPLRWIVHQRCTYRVVAPYLRATHAFAINAQSSTPGTHNLSELHSSRYHAPSAKRFGLLIFRQTTTSPTVFYPEASHPARTRATPIRAIEH